MVVESVVVTVVVCVNVVGTVVVPPSTVVVLVVVAVANVSDVVDVAVAVVVVANGAMWRKAEQNACASCLSKVPTISGAGRLDGLLRARCLPRCRKERLFGGGPVVDMWTPLLSFHANLRAVVFTA